MIIFQNSNYYDDRLFIFYLCKCTINISSDDMVETTIYHEENPNGSIWCLITYKNCERYPVSTINHFNTKDKAIDYIKKVEPSTPLISLDGQSPKQPLQYIEYLQWKKAKNLKEYDYKDMYTLSGTNPKEVIWQTKEQFAKSHISI